jgi:hypothetical protein
MVRLSRAEMTVGAMTGVLRQIDNAMLQRKGRNGEAGQHDWQLHIEGALGEQALAKWIGTFWSGEVGNLSAADIGAKIEARTTSRLDGSLILHEWDRDDAFFFLLTGQHGTYRIAGWIEGRAGKQAAFWRDPVGGRAAYFVPQAALHPPAHFMHSLRITVADEVTLPYGRDAAMMPKRRVALPLLPVEAVRSPAEADVL